MTSYGEAKKHDEMTDYYLRNLGYEDDELETRWDGVANRRRVKDAKRSTYMRGCVYSRNR